MITVHMAISLDGFIAKKDNCVSWFDTTCDFLQGIEYPNDENFPISVDCYVMGSHTFEFAHELSKEHGWPYGETPTIVLTSRNLTTERNNIEFFKGDLQTCVEKLRLTYKRIWVVGGAQVANDFIRTNLAQEIQISILPILLGDGIPFFSAIPDEKPLQLKNTFAYKNGIVELQYSLR